MKPISCRLIWLFIEKCNKAPGFLPCWSYCSSGINATVLGLDKWLAKTDRQDPSDDVVEKLWATGISATAYMCDKPIGFCSSFCRTHGTDLIPGPTTTRTPLQPQQNQGNDSIILKAQQHKLYESLSSLPFVERAFICRHRFHDRSNIHLQNIFVNHMNCLHIHKQVCCWSNSFLGRFLSKVILYKQVCIFQRTSPKVFLHRCQTSIRLSTIVIFALLSSSCFANSHGLPPRTRAESPDAIWMADTSVEHKDWTLFLFGCACIVFLLLIWLLFWFARHLFTLLSSDGWLSEFKILAPVTAPLLATFSVLVVAGVKSLCAFFLLGGVLWPEVGTDVNARYSQYNFLKSIRNSVGTLKGSNGIGP